MESRITKMASSTLFPRTIYNDRYITIMVVRVSETYALRTLKRMHGWIESTICVRSEKTLILRTHRDLRRDE